MVGKAGECIASAQGEPVPTSSNQPEGFVFTASEGNCGGGCLQIFICKYFILFLVNSVILKLNKTPDML